MKVIRAELLQRLTVAATGLTKKEILEQSDCYVFTEDDLLTFNGEILTRANNPLPSVTGAVPAEDLHKILSKFPDEELQVTMEEDELRIKGKRRTAGITMHAGISLPFDDVPSPDKWVKAPERLSGVLLQAARCCGRDGESQAATTVVHVGPDVVEAFDNRRLFRYEMETGVRKHTLIPGSSLEQLGGLAFERISQSGGWLHFKMPEDHVISVRCVKGEYPDLSPHMKLKNPQKVSLPPNLADILSRAEIMQEASFDASVDVSIEDGKLLLTARKETGWYRESKKIDYDGEPLRFSVHPKFLEEVFTKKKTVLVGGNRMKLKVKEATFVVSLQVKEEE